MQSLQLTALLKLQRRDLRREVACAPILAPVECAVVLKFRVRVMIAKLVVIATGLGGKRS